MARRHLRATRAACAATPQNRRLVRNERRGRQSRAISRLVHQKDSRKTSAAIPTGAPVARVARNPNATPKFVCRRGKFQRGETEAFLPGSTLETLCATQ